MNPKKLASLLKKLKPKVDPQEHVPADPVSQLVISFLNWETSRRQAEQAFDRLMAQMVDINELRISFEPEIVQIIGTDYPLATQRVMRMREALNEIYIREHDVKMHSVASKGKKEQRAYLDTLPATPPYVVSQVMLLSFGGHALPVDTKLVGLLAREGIVETGTPPQDVETFLLRNIRAEDALEAHFKLQGWADDSRLSPDVSGPEPSVPETRQPNAARTATKKKKTKKTAKKTTKRPTRLAKKK